MPGVRRIDHDACDIVGRLVGDAAATAHQQ
jgi:hypothetical protein